MAPAHHDAPWMEKLYEVAGQMGVAPDEVLFEGDVGQSTKAAYTKKWTAIKEEMCKELGVDDYKSCSAQQIEDLASTYIQNRRPDAAAAAAAAAPAPAGGQPAGH